MDLLTQKSFLKNFINYSFHLLISSRDSVQADEECTMPPKEDTEFLLNLRLSDLFNLPGEDVPMTAEMFGALSNGKKSWLEKLRSPETPMACLKSHRGDSALHLVAAWGHLEGVKNIVSECPCLLLKANSKDQLPIHVAARAGHSAVVEAFVKTVTFVSDKLTEERERLNLYVVKDINGDTPLHSALKGNHMQVAFYLVKANRQASFLANKDGKSPLYLAVEAGNLSLVKEMLRDVVPEGGKSNLHPELEGRKYLVHAALELRNTDILNVILKKIPSLMEERDEEGRTCLSFGAFVGNYEGVCNLLHRSESSVFECNDDGSFPIHVAVEKGHNKVVRLILRNFPHSKHMLNKKGQNILHIAANSGKFQSLCQMVVFFDTIHMVDEQDVDGNTPLHLATIKWRPRAARFLMGRSNMLIQNNNGLTVFDIAVLNIQPNYIFRERLTLVVLALGYARTNSRFLNRTISSQSLDHGGNKDYINALLLVAALIATVTFAAAFTLPGSFNSSDPNLGMAALATDPRLISFLIFDMLAMQFSVVAVISLMWAQLGDPALCRSSVSLALASLYSALQFMALAFLFGLVIAAGNVTGLVIFISVTFVFFLVAIFFIAAPHLFLQAPVLEAIQIPFYRAIWSVYLIYFMVFLNDNGDENNQTSTHKSMKSAESMEISGNDHVEMPDTT